MRGGFALLGASALLAVSLVAKAGYDPGPYTPSATFNALANKLPAQAGTIAGLMYANTAPVTVSTTTPISVFSGGSTARTFGANTLVAGKTFRIHGGGVYTAPTGNTQTAAISLKVGAGASIVSVTTPAALAANNQSARFEAECTVQSNGTSMICTGQFSFVVLGGTYIPVPFNSVSAVTFDPIVANLVDLFGSWSGTTGSPSCTVQTLSLEALN